MKLVTIATWHTRESFYSHACLLARLPMLPCVPVLAGRALAQREAGSSNPFCKVTYRQLSTKKLKKFKTKQKKRALDPVWNEVFQLYVVDAPEHERERERSVSLESDLIRSFVTGPVIYDMAMRYYSSAGIKANHVRE